MYKRYSKFWYELGIHQKDCIFCIPTYKWDQNYMEADKTQSPKVQRDLLT